MKNSRIVGLILVFLLFGMVSSGQAVSIGLSLTADQNLTTIGNNETVTFTVGINPPTTITGYTLDILIDSGELIYQSAQELLVNSLAFTVNPGDGLSTSESGRASLLQLSNIDSATDLFSLTFLTGNVLGDGLPDITVGILDSAADDINKPVGGAPLTIAPDTVSASVGVIPEPTSLILMGTGLVGFAGIGRKRS